MSRQIANTSWGPSHQRAVEPGRKRAELAWRLAGWSVLILGSYLAIAPGISVVLWALGALVVLWLARAALEAVAEGRLPFGRGGAEEGARLRDSDLRTEASRLGGGAYLGVGRGEHLVLADPESAVMVLGPPRSGKTSAVMIPAVLASSGAVVSTSTKPEVLRATVEVRSEIGQAWLFDPSAAAEQLPSGVRRLSWSPVAASGSWDEALITARAMSACTRAGAGTMNEGHWAERSAALLAPLLHAANLSAQPIAAVLRWVLRGELEEAEAILVDGEAAIAADVLEGIERTEARERSSIFSAAAGVLAAYNADGVRGMAERPNFDPARFATSTDTVYVTAPEQRQALCAPLIVGLLEQIRQAVYARAAQQEGSAGGALMLWALDEAANIAPIQDLPALISQAGGQGLQVMVGLQDLSQARSRWGVEAAEGFMTLFQTKLILSGIGDPATLEAISMALGEYDRILVSSSQGQSETGRWHDPYSHSESVSRQTHRQRVLGPGEIARLPVGQGLLLRGADWGLVGLRRWV